MHSVFLPIFSNKTLTILLLVSWPSN